MMKRVVLVLLAVLVGLGMALGAVFGITFAGIGPLKDASQLSRSAKQIKADFVSIVFLDLGDGSVALVDCGADPEGKHIKQELKARGKTVDNVVAVLLTHGHGDHTAGCAAVPKASLYAMADEADLVAGRAGSDSPLGALVPVSLTGLEVSHRMRNGDQLELGALHIEAFSLPGHTQGSAAYLIEGVLYFGDSANSSSDGELTKTNFIFSEDVDQNVASLKALNARLASRAASIQKLAFAHSGPLNGMGPLSAFAAEN
jgi:glyoxylase-like metal-dependent hydrolase (beta-lactamase superfamily II)